MNKATINFNLSLHLVDLLVKQKPLNCLSNDLSSNHLPNDLWATISMTNIIIPSSSNASKDIIPPALLLING